MEEGVHAVQGPGRSRAGQAAVVVPVAEVAARGGEMLLEQFGHHPSGDPDSDDGRIGGRPESDLVVRAGVAPGGSGQDERDDHFAA